MESTVMISSLLCNILIGSFSIVVLTWAAVGIQTLFNDRKEEKRKEKERAKKRKALKDMAKQAQKDAETLEKYRLKFEKQKAREAEKAARKKKKKRE